MLRSNAVFFRHTAKVLDMFAVSSAFLLTLTLLGSVGDAFNRQYLLLLFGSLPIWLFVSYFVGGYRSLRERPRKIIFAMFLKAAVLFAGIQWAVISFLAFDEVSRNVLLIYPLAAALMISLLRLVVMTLLAHARKLGYNSRSVIIVGLDAAAAQYAQVVKAQLDWGLEVHGFLGYDKGTPESPVPGVPVLGHVGELAEVVSTQPVDQIVFSVPSDGRMNRLEEGFAVCKEMGIEAVLLPHFATLPGVARVENFFSIPVVHYAPAQQQGGDLVLKQMMDLVLSSLALIALSPLLALIALAVKFTSAGPVFFSQYRVGLNGRRFKCYKFRTMFVDAEQRLEELRHLNEMDGPVFKIRNDPRITAAGRLLRRYSLDELPQFYNVFLGDMSLVGPRPPLPAEVSQYTRSQRRRLSVKPGITCIWQVSGRNNIDFDSWVQLDLEYIDQWSIGLDVKLLLRTAATVVRGTGM